MLPDVGPDVTCATPAEEIPEWAETRAPSAVRLTNGTIEFEDPDEPCVIPPGGGYRGLENQLYRVEIHSGTDLSDARFKWSRENASVGARVEEIEAPDRLIVRRIGRDSVLSFHTGDWVEITDDNRELHGQSGDIRRVTVDEDSRTLELSDALSPDLIPSNIGDDTLAARHTRVIRWDQRGPVFLEDGTEWEDLDANTSDGLIPVPADGSAVQLEAGVVVSFSAEPAGDPLYPMDYWCFFARTAGAQIEPLVEAPPKGIHHHYARLAVVTFPASVLDCRVFWPPDFGVGDDCACTVCVTPESHNSGTLTIQAAIDQLPTSGGTVCLETGNYFLGTSPVVVAGRSSVRLRGKGSATTLAYNGEGGAIRIHSSSDSEVQDLAVITTPAAPDTDDVVPAPSAGIHLRNVLRVAVRKVLLLTSAGPENEDQGLTLDGLQIGVRIEECLVVAPIGVGPLANLDQQDDGPAYLLLAEVRIFDNLLAGNRAIGFSGVTLHLTSVEVVRNLIFAANGGGMLFTGAGIPAAPVTVESNTISVTAGGDGVVVGIPNSRIEDNEILTSGPVAGTCLVLQEGLIPEQTLDAQIIANRMSGGFGLRIEADLGALLVKRNLTKLSDGRDHDDPGGQHRDHRNRQQRG